MSRTLYSLLFLFIAFQNAFPQGELLPEKPKWGEQVTIRYDPQHPEAELKSSQDIFVFLRLTFENGSNQNHTLQLEKENEIYAGTYLVPKPACYLTVRFFSLKNLERRGNLSTFVYRPDGRIARGARIQEVFRVKVDKIDSLIEEEHRQYPDNYAIYRQKWFRMTAPDQSGSEEKTRKDIERIEALQLTGNEEWLYALSAGYMFLGEEEKSRTYLLKLMDRFPTSPYLSSAYGTYNYQVFKYQIKGEGPAIVKEKIRGLVQRFPEASLGRDIARRLSRDEAFPLSAMEALTEAWQSEEPENPEPYIHFSSASLLHQEALEEGEAQAKKALNLLLQSKGRFYGDFSGRMEDFYIPTVYLTLARINYLREDYAEALSAARMSRELQGEFDEIPFLLEAELWENLGREAQAEHLLAEAFRMGSDTARVELSRFYQNREGSLQGFESYLNDLLEQEGDREKVEAPVFQTTDMEGNPVDLEKLRGKVVVLNFWFIGCAPCIVEIPGLNKLVEEYADRGVEFLAIALDQKKYLDDFLTEKEFKYHIIPEGVEIAQKYGVEGYPTHVIINPDGEIESRLTGGNPQRHKDIKPLIERLLIQNKNQAN